MEKIKIGRNELAAQVGLYAAGSALKKLTELLPSMNSIGYDSTNDHIRFLFDSAGKVLKNIREEAEITRRAGAMLNFRHEQNEKAIRDFQAIRESISSIKSSEIEVVEGVVSLTMEGREALLERYNICVSQAQYDIYQEAVQISNALKALDDKLFAFGVYALSEVGQVYTRPSAIETPTLEVRPTIFSDLRLDGPYIGKRWRPVSQVEQKKPTNQKGGSKNSQS